MRTYQVLSLVVYGLLILVAVGNAWAHMLIHTVIVLVLMLLLALTLFKPVFVSSGLECRHIRSSLDLLQTLNGRIDPGNPAKVAVDVAVDRLKDLEAILC
jgi:hypothetical protein